MCACPSWWKARLVSQSHHEGFPACSTSCRSQRTPRKAHSENVGQSRILRDIQDASTAPVERVPSGAARFFSSPVSKEWSGSPLLRALRDHRFIVGPQRAQRTVWPFSPSLSASPSPSKWKDAHVGPTAPVERGPSLGRAFGEHRTKVGGLPQPPALASDSSTPVQCPIFSLTHWLFE